MSLILSGTDGLSDVDGTAATPAIRGTDANTGIFFPAADTIAFAEGGAEVARFDSSGNFLVGTATPSATYGRITVSGSGISITPDTAAKFQIGRYSAGAPYSYIKMGSTSSGFKFTDPADSVDLAVLDSAGNFGLGVTPSAWQTAAGSRAIQFLGSAVYGYRDTDIILTQNAYFDGSFKYYASSIAAGYYNIGGGVHRWTIAPSGTAGSAITFTQAMTLDASGNLLVGVTSGSYHTLAKDIAGNFATEIRNSNANPYGLYIRYSGAAPNGSINEFLYIGDTVGQKMSVRSNGGIANYSASNFNLASDFRLKHNIEPVKSYWDVFKAIEWKTWLYNDQTDEIKNIGVIAQELQVLAPEFVSESNLKETPEGESPYLGLWENDFKMAGMSVITELVKRCEQQQALITTLTDRITALENK
jgi:hypothetical protein